MAQIGRIGESADAYRSAIRLKPDFASAHNSLGAILLAQRQIVEARECFQCVVRLNPESAGAHNNLGNAFMEENRHEEAVACFREAVRLQPDMIEGHADLGRALAQLGRSGEALPHLEQALRLNPRRPETYNDLAITLAAQNRFDEALGYARALELRPDYSEARRNRGATGGTGFSPGGLEEAESRGALPTGCFADFSTAQPAQNTATVRISSDDRAIVHLRFDRVSGKRA